VSAWALAAAVTAGAAAVMWWPTASLVRRRVLADEWPGRRNVPRWLAPVGSALAVTVVIEGVLGVLLAIALAVVVHRHSGRALTRPQRALAARRALELPMAVEVLASCLAVGATQQRALRTVADGLGGTLAADFSRVSGALGVGADVSEAWGLVSAPDLRSLASLLGRAHITGAPVVPQLWMLADQHRQHARVVAMDAARTLGVRSTGPLGLCFLPAFVLVAIAPLVLSILAVGV